jgi:hypothetical protein
VSWLPGRRPAQPHRKPTADPPPGHSSPGAPGRVRCAAGVALGNDPLAA